jgi:hypothetical protein
MKIPTQSATSSAAAATLATAALIAVVWQTSRSKRSNFEAPSTPRARPAASAAVAIETPAVQPAPDVQAPPSEVPLASAGEAAATPAGGEPLPELEEPVTPVALQHMVHEETLQCPPAAAREALLGASSTFMVQFREVNGGSNVCVGGWSARAGGAQLRKIAYTQAVMSRLTPVRATGVDETQVVAVLADGSIVLQIRMIFADVPFANYFSVHTKLLLSARGGGAQLAMSTEVTGRPIEHAAPPASRAGCTS